MSPINDIRPMGQNVRECKVDCMYDKFFEIFENAKKRQVVLKAVLNYLDSKLV